MEIKEIIKKIQAVVKKNPQVELAYLFGSYALGQENKDSDVDVAVQLSKSLNQSQRFDLRLKLGGLLSRELKKEVDVVVLNDTKSLHFKYIIVSEGKPVYQKNDVTGYMFENFVFAEYFDFRPFLDEYNKAYVQRSLQ